MSNRLRIALVNDLELALEALRRTLQDQTDYKIIWEARNGAEAVEKAKENRPDIILMDLQMPKMDGVEATRLIMANHPCAILIVTVSVEGYASRVFEAMGHGAIDAVDCPVLQQGHGVSGAEVLLKKIHNLHILLGRSTQPQDTACRPEPTQQPKIPIYAIGASTGGPAALATLLEAVPKDFNAALVIIQHVDARFGDSLVYWLQSHCAIPVQAAIVGDSPQKGTVYLAVSNDHLILNCSYQFNYIPEPKALTYRPSIDVFFSSLARCNYPPAVATLLTGMGRDGAQGLLILRNQGWHTIAQDEESSIIFGMPKAAIELKAATDILPIEKIGPRIVSISKRVAIGP